MQAYIKDAYTPHIKALLSSLEAADAPELHFLEVGLAEATNVVWKHEVIFESIAPDYTNKVIDNLKGIPLLLHPIEGYLVEVLSFGRSHHPAIYDSLYVALAQALGVPLITADQKQEAVARAAGIAIKPIADFSPAP